MPFHGGHNAGSSSQSLLPRTPEAEEAYGNSALAPTRSLYRARELDELSNEVQLNGENVSVWRRHARNLGVIVKRNALAVAAPALAREAARECYLEPLVVASPAAGIVLGSAALLMPITTHAVGAMRDYRDGTSSRVKVFCRITHVVLVLVAGVILICFSGFVSAVPALAAANLVYAPLRDLAQYQGALRDHTAVTPRGAFAATGISAAIYGVSQATVGWTLNLAANGLEGIGSSRALANVISRPVFTLFGDTVDEYIFRQLRVALGDHRTLEIDWVLRPEHASEDNPGYERSWRASFDQILNTYAGRSSLLAAAGCASAAAGQRGAGPVLGNIVAGVAFAAGYVPGVYLQPQPTSPQGDPLQRNIEASRPRSASSYREGLLTEAVQANSGHGASDPRSAP